MTETVVSADPRIIAMELLMKAPATVSSPYPHYHALRAAAPKYRMEQPGQGVGWVLTTYDECRAALRSPSLDKSAQRPRMGDFRGREGARTLLFLDGPEHTRLRGLVSRVFTPRRVETLRPRLTAFVDSLLDEVTRQVGPRGGEIDLVGAFGFPLPVMVIGELVGVPPEDWPLLRRLTRAASGGLEIFAPEEVLKASDQALGEMEEYFADLVRKRREEPRDDLATALGQVEVDGDKLSVDELIQVIVLLFGAGFQTMTDLIGLGTYALCRNPDQMQRLREQPELTRSAIEELLRYDSPVHVLGRAAFEDTTFLDGTPLAAGEHVITLIGAANRDPARYADPDVLDIARFAGPEPPETPLSFAWGPHHCLGAQLARAEGQIAFRRLVDRFSVVELADPDIDEIDLEWRHSSTFRGLEELRLRLVPA
ncbi:cytochrome P450 [Micromonospora globbae]|jgi:cytochrome P450|uniref:Cytochrome P450 n=1 Tax=Micromonospora globbae TaxID=1894969 RepID=A0A420EVZ3_9ACTN|nr:cytochrome P450 [Micromonospora globbae]RKF24869.1 cytochrome P450 [Micromonospora globbae]